VNGRVQSEVYGCLDSKMCCSSAGESCEVLLQNRLRGCLECIARMSCDVCFVQSTDIVHIDRVYDADDDVDASSVFAPSSNFFLFSFAPASIFADRVNCLTDILDGF
jgi:hypothetical protein